MSYRLILADEGSGKVHYVNLAVPSEKWSVSCSNRDLQLVGKDILMVSDNGGSGYSEISIKTGALIRHLSIAGVNSGINSVFKLTDSTIYCARDGSPAKILRLDSAGKQLDAITLSLDASVRICRPTSSGTFLIGGKTAGIMCEFDAAGKKIAEMNVGGEPYMALRLTDGTTLISTGYGAELVRTDRQGKILRRFPDKTEKERNATFWKNAKPNFFAGFQILDNGNIVVANWQGHGNGYGTSGYQLLEFDSSLTTTVSYWKQDAAMVSSLHGVLVLDNLDTRLLHSDVNGIMQPVNKPIKAESVPIQRRADALTQIHCLQGVFDLQGRISNTGYVSSGILVGAGHKKETGIHISRQAAGQ